MVIKTQMQLSKFGALQKINNQVMMQRKGLIASRLHTQCGNMKKEENIAQKKGLGVGILQGLKYQPKIPNALSGPQRGPL